MGKQQRMFTHSLVHSFMFLHADFQPYTLQFKFEAGTSRGVLREKKTYFLKIYDPANPQVFGLGECSTLPYLSIDHRPDYETVLGTYCHEFNKVNSTLETDYKSKFSFISDNFPSILFGFETAWQDIMNGGRSIIFDTPFSRSETKIPINGLIWMGKPDWMQEQIDEKISQGYTTLKLKIGAINFDEECRLLEKIRDRFSPEQLTLRVDANGAFSPEEALHRLKTLAQFGLHSIEQPIRQGQLPQMQALCQNSPVPVALDEELIGIMDFTEKEQLLQTLRPPFIILKPSLLGGFRHCREWIQLAEQQDISWWMTSALESNIGLNAIAQFTSTFVNPLPQGLGTGQLYKNNVPSNLEVNGGFLYHKTNNERTQ
jgi:o-succinylbenzoate synthase